jgi:hypothetical protein
MNWTSYATDRSQHIYIRCISSRSFRSNKWNKVQKKKKMCCCGESNQGPPVHQSSVLPTPIKLSVLYLDVGSSNILLACGQPRMQKLKSEQFFSYPVAVTNTGDRTANLDLCLALMAFNSEVLFFFFRANSYCDTGPRFIRSHLKDRHPRPTAWNSNRGCKNH